MGIPLTSLVSGGSRGLGLAIVERLLARGDRLATFSRTGSPALDALAAAHPDRLHAETLDGSDSAAVIGFVGRVAERFGGIDHCIANAAVAHEGVLATMRDDEIDQMLAVNVKASIVLVRECVRQMLAPEKGGRHLRCLPPFSTTPSITLISSIVATRGSAGLSVYAATKAALEGFGRSLARELGPRGIRVNAVAPGFLETDLSATLSADNRGRIARRTPLGRLGTPADVVGAIEFLTSPAAAFITGQVLTIDGGG
ncbi:3-oxoacyl-ACP reductase [Planctomycetia bacterium]|nr:3-oxoacyl-ACP reductase [Planctomycetia bacterium]